HAAAFRTAGAELLQEIEAALVRSLDRAAEADIDEGADRTFGEAAILHARVEVGCRPRGRRLAGHVAADPLAARRGIGAQTHQGLQQRRSIEAHEQRLTPPVPDIPGAIERIHALARRRLLERQELVVALDRAPLSPDGARKLG